MKVVMLNTSDAIGGAAIAALRLAKALQKQDIEVKILVQNKTTNLDFVEGTSNNFFNKFKNFSYFAIERFIFKLHEKNPSVRFAFSMANTGEDISKHKFVKEADIIHLHWINFGFLSLKSLEKIFKLGKPVVWTLHDMWAFTGGCHHSYDCKKYESDCGNCSIYLNKPKEKDLSNIVWNKKNSILPKYPINIVSVSNWLSECSRKSSLFRNQKHFTIHNSLNLNFIAKDKSYSKKHLGISPDKKILLFGSYKIENPNKGFDYFIEALKILKEDKSIESGNFLIVLFGNIKISKEDFFLKIPFEYKYLGFVKDVKELSNVYSAASITVTPSLYESFGQVITESMICKTPVVAFNNTGPKDIINHKKNGYLAKFKSSEDLAKGIKWILFESEYETLCKAAYIDTKNNFSDTVIASQYIKLYNKII